ncbi:peptide/nickel transport system permease protein [Pseudonocardia thermophila]|uniref:Peptide/nickel transport system permease protein n=1 Tax=Pseudonocardia thermophila TaxID=1848 RepID=A0A1M6XLX2_PSETH|nr:ABC transporter permease [Pseudonocardia thermophila]SHL06859.1 peptide/nickel transport system permease protein [Pseudonocardia thermophila]
MSEQSALRVSRAAAPASGRAAALRRRYRLLRRPLALVSWAILVAVLVIGFFGPLVTDLDPLRQTREAFLPIGSPGHPLGTDDLGRDVLARMIYGARPLLVVSLVATALAAVLGIGIGLVAGYFGGRVDWWLMRLIDLAVAFPSILLIILIVAGMGAGETGLTLGIGLALAPGLARLARALALRESAKDYVSAAQIGGARTPGIILTEILPNVAGPLLAQSIMTLSTAAGFAAGLSYIGLGIQPPTPDWGYMVAAGQEFLFNAPRLVLLPALATLVFVVACNFVGDDLRDVLDPRSNR